MAKTTEEQIAELKKKQEQIAQQLRAKQARLKAEERKARTKRLIAIGAEVEHYAKCEITDLDSFKAYLEKYGSAIANTQPKKANEAETEVSNEASTETETVSAEEQDTIMMQNDEETEKHIPNFANRGYN